MRILHQQVFEVTVGEVSLNGDAIDVGAGGQTEIWIRGNVERKARRSGSIVPGTSHPLRIGAAARVPPVAGTL